MNRPRSDLGMPYVSWRTAYLLRLKRKRLLWRAFRARRHIRRLSPAGPVIPADDIVVVSVLRNERARLPYFLEHYRRLGVSRFLMVDNGSTDGSDAYLRSQQDVSLWQTTHSYRAARFGVDWSMWLLRRYGHQRWCLTVDVDELLVFDGSDTRGLPDLVHLLDTRGVRGFGALMLDLYPEGRLSEMPYHAGQSPMDVLKWFDPGPYRAMRQEPLGNLWVQGGARERVFFSEQPVRSPTLNKIPLVKWHRSYAYANSTHSLLPRDLNAIYCGPGGDEPSGVLLHTKFLPEVVSKSETEKERKQHFYAPQDFDHYYDKIISAPNLRYEGSQLYDGAKSLISLGLMPRINW